MGGNGFDGKTGGTPNGTLGANPRDAGIVRIGFAGSSDLGGTSPVAQVTFKAVGQPGQRTPLRLEVTTISGAAGGRP